MLFSLALACTVLGARADAQAPVPAVLTEVRLVSESKNASRFRLVFSPKSNSFGQVGADSGRAALGLALTTRDRSAVSPTGLKGLVRQISFDQADTVLIVHFATSSPATLSAANIDASTVEVTVSNGIEKSNVNADAVSASGGSLPQALAPRPGQTYELVMLRYADVSEVVGLLTDGLTVKSNDSFVPHEPGFGTNGLTGANYAATAALNDQSDAQPMGQSVDSAIAIDRRLNAVWLKGTLEEIARMKAEIALIDVPVDSVILETQLVELTENGARAIGIDFANSAGQIASGTIQTGQYMPIGTTANTGGHLNPGGAFVGGMLASAQLQAAIYAQISKGAGKIVSRPRIAAQSGATAKIITGDALPILTSITLSGVNGVSQQVQYVNVGVTLQIAPRVSADGFVTSHVFCVVSSVTGYSQGYPTISQREAETQATVQDGQTFVIGGLTQESTISSDGKVPLLGDVPGLGAFFRNKKFTKQNTELYIVVTPHIVRRVMPNTAPEPQAMVLGRTVVTPEYVPGPQSPDYSPPH
ncbi:MAG: hypothetical protein M3N34_10580 [Pseudomonadota bacterium]|nr:hypothetical protein [Pseudomonadota bacterium]